VSERPRGRALLLGVVVAVVAAAVAAAVLVLDSPAEERRRRLDERRVEDLHALADAIDAYWTREESLPRDLDALTGWQGLDTPTTDPVTGDPYRYHATGERSYELCATFETEAPAQDPRWPRRRHGPFWHHPAGDHCFELEAEAVER
jgi:hypothetical protein